MRSGAIVRAAAIYACHERVRVESFGSEGALVCFFFFFNPANTLSYTLKDAEEILSLHTGRTDVIPMKLTAVLIHRLRARAHIVTSYYCESLVLSELYATSCYPRRRLPPRATPRPGVPDTFNCTIVGLARPPISVEGLISNLRLKSIVSGKEKKRKRDVSL